MSTTSQEKRVRDEKSHPGYGFAVEGLASGLSANVHVRLGSCPPRIDRVGGCAAGQGEVFFFSSRRRAHPSDSWRNTACQSEGEAYQRCPFADGDSLLPIVCIATIQNNAAPLCKSASLGEFSR
jgi:hypothetical protein